MSTEDKKDFCITHFFNPVRYMGLLEIVQEINTDKSKVALLKIFVKLNLAKVLSYAVTPGFLGNRIGVYAMQVAMTFIKMKLSVEEADAVLVDQWEFQKQEFSHYMINWNRFNAGRTFKF